MSTQLVNAETLKNRNANNVPKTMEELWQDFNPQIEPLNIEVIREYEIDNVIVKIVRFRVGIFNGEEIKIAGIYGYPKGGKNLPALLQIHGGGQAAHQNAVVTNAKRGYATFSLAWAGRIGSDKYVIRYKELKDIWDGKSSLRTTDWGSLEGYHAPSRYKRFSIEILPASKHTIDRFKSPRNSVWFLWAMAARRSITFLEQRAQVDKDRIGVYGHSMGGRLTVMTAGTDKRVKAAAPSCGGISNRDLRNTVYDNALADDEYLKNISCPILFLSPSNDFHGKLEDLPKALQEIKSKDWRLSVAPHHNHQDTPEYEVCSILWFDQYLKNEFKFPKNPIGKLAPLEAGKEPQFVVKVDNSREIKSVDIYYSRAGSGGREHTIHRPWFHAKAEKINDSTWQGALSLANRKQPLWVYANVTYNVGSNKTAAGYYYGIFSSDTFTLSSVLQDVNIDDLRTAEVKFSREKTNVIEDFQGDWQKEWFDYNSKTWVVMTNKIYDKIYSMPENSLLVLEVESDKPQKMVVGLDGYKAEIKLNGKVQTIELKPADFKNQKGETLSSWKNCKNLQLKPFERYIVDGKLIVLGTEKWQGEAPTFKKISTLKK